MRWFLLLALLAGLAASLRVSNKLLTSTIASLAILASPGTYSLAHILIHSLTHSLTRSGASFGIEQQYKLPPIDRKDPNRCQLQSSSMGQANAARDKLYDLRECDLKGQGDHTHPHHSLTHLLSYDLTHSLTHLLAHL